MDKPVLEPPGTYGRSCFRVGQVLPAILTTQELASLLGVSGAHGSVLQRQGHLAIFELLPRVGNRPRYSGRKVQQWLDGELQENTTIYGGPLRRRWPGASR